MPTECMEHPAATVVYGHGIDLPRQAARVRAMWVAGRNGRPPVLMVALLWARECADVVQSIEHYLDALFADYRCTPQSWSEAQAARQVLAALNQQLFRRKQAGREIAELNVGLLLLQEGSVQFLQAGSIGLLRYQNNNIHTLVGRDGLQIGEQAELALIQYSLPLNEGDLLLLAPQPLLGVADLNAYQNACQRCCTTELQGLLEPLLSAPSAGALLLSGDSSQFDRQAGTATWPVVENATVGMQIDGWTITGSCSFGPPGRVFKALDAAGRCALLWLSEQPADDVFWQREWAMRRSPVPGLPQVLSAFNPREHAFTLFEYPSADMRSLADWAAGRGPLAVQGVMSIIKQAIDGVRALQRRGMQGLWLNPRNILIAESGRVLLFAEHAVLIPGAPRQAMPVDALPLAPEMRMAGGRVDGRADQFALAALAYWLLCGQWPEIARPEASPVSHYVPLANFNRRLPEGWDGVLARALAPQAASRFDALSEFQQALQQPLQQSPGSSKSASKVVSWRVWVVGILLLQLSIGLLVSLAR
ncbi:protein kinase [Pseudomonas segetis]|uniref:Serine/threonine protein kinase n=1 Tax=Pseudomonas segetis TaxID=298908 RepID=A0A239H7K4_9PSED|nr:protein kinase [Pseudomonas segetis]SNS76234.1 Serine/threonine protein kinase [Pseudomonas segetis]